METLIQLFTVDSVAHAVLVISLVGAFGLALGSIRIFGINLGIAGVLFVGLLFGHFQLTLSDHVIEFIRDFGLILFVYTIGMQVGPGFIASFKKEGLPLNMMAAGVVLLGAIITIALSHFGNIAMPAAIGMFSGATTNTPSLAAAQQALNDIPGISEELVKLPALGYAVAYPFGIIGIILTMIFIRVVFGINPQKEAEIHAKLIDQSKAPLTTMNLEVKNTNLNGIAIKDIPSLEDLGVVLSRVCHKGKIQVAKPDIVIHTGDILLAVGPKDKLEQLRIIIGVASEVDLKSLPSEITTRRIVVTRKEVVGKTLEELNLLARYGVTVTRVSRAEIELTASPDLRLQLADAILVVGEKDDIQEASKVLGNSPRQLNHPQVIPIFVGLALGVILGSLPIHFPGMPAGVKLGLAGGPLIVAIFLSNVRNFGPLVWYMPISANFMLRELGIVLFLTAVGLKSGDKFVSTLVQGDGFYWMACATLITLLPLLLVAFFARMKYKLNYMTLCGLLAGSMTDPPALAFANTLTGSHAPSVSYATVYPLVMLLRVISAQVIVLFFVH